MTQLPSSNSVESPINDRPRPARQVPGETGIWVFISGDLIVFSLFFIIFVYYRAGDLDVFVSSAGQLNQFFGLANTMLMLTSSLAVALGIEAARRPDKAHRTRPLLLIAAGCGIGFVIVKIFEWGDKIRHGISLTTNDFFMYYFMFTGIHLFHVFIALGVVTLMIARVRRSDQVAQSLMLLEAGGIFWHLVDLLWVVLFALFYLI